MKSWGMEEQSAKGRLQRAGYAWSHTEKGTDGKLHGQDPAFTPWPRATGTTLCQPTPQLGYCTRGQREAGTTGSPLIPPTVGNRLAVSYHVIVLSSLVLQTSFIFSP